ncbi:hypothetical protein EJB05_45859, partial [Eragrostis curvula]
MASLAAAAAAATAATFATAKARARLSVSCSASNSDGNTTTSSNNFVSVAVSSVKTFSAALALSSVLLSSAATSPPPAAADIAGLTPCKESKAFAKREKNSIKKLTQSLNKYAPDSAPALAINATIEKTKRRFDNYGKFGLLCGADGLPHLIVSGDQRHWGEFITPGLLFLYITGGATAGPAWAVAPPCYLKFYQGLVVLGSQVSK